MVVGVDIILFVKSLKSANTYGKKWKKHTKTDNIIKIGGMLHESKICCNTGGFTNLVWL